MSANLVLETSNQVQQRIQLNKPVAGDNAFLHLMFDGFVSSPIVRKSEMIRATFPGRCFAMVSDFPK